MLYMRSNSSIELKSLKEEVFLIDFYKSLIFYLIWMCTVYFYFSSILIFFVLISFSGRMVCWLSWCVVGAISSSSATFAASRHAFRHSDTKKSPPHSCPPILSPSPPLPALLYLFWSQIDFSDLDFKGLKKVE